MKNINKYEWITRLWFLLLVGVVALGGYGLTAQAANPEPAGWYAGDMHVHRSCGGSPEAVSSLYSKMSTNNLAAISLLADIGNGEVQNPITDLPLVNGLDASVSTSGRIVHWDAEWHWDATYGQYPHQALGGHLVALGLSEAHQIWEEYTYPILNWADQQNAIAGFVHMQYLDDGIPQSLYCCIPIEYPVEVALGAADFIAEDVTGSDSAIQAYYRLLNNGFRPSFAAGTDYPCGVSELGSLLTYVQVAGGQMTYRNWIDGIKQGRTVVSRNGHNEFLNLTVNNTATPGDEIKLTNSGSVPVTIEWTAKQNLTGTIELVQNGVVVASNQASVAAGGAANLTAEVNFTKSGWLTARRMGSNGHQLQTGAVFVTVNNQPVRVSATDAEFYVQWMDNLLEKTSPGGAWSSYFDNSLSAAQARYQAAKAIYQQIALEAGATPQPLAIATTSLPDGIVGLAYSATLMASGGITPYSWSINSGLPSGLTFNNGVITGNPATAGTYIFTVQVSDAGNPGQTVTKPLSITIAATPPVATTIWPVSATPSVAADPDTSAVELGVKFRSSVNGFITGIRFYKGTANTGTHIGSLWDSSGNLQAQATFTNETASGWQQVNFATPVAITGNITYVASYHAPNGRYSVNEGYFASSGVTNGSLYALRDGESGGNGVYRYGSVGFPSNTYQASNYWVDIVFQPAGAAPALTAITLTPANPSISIGATQQFTAMGTYSDGGTKDVSSQANWASLDTAVATVNASGLATAVTAGASTISTTLSGLSNSTVLTVQAAPFSITTASLPNGTVNTAYSATLAASGGAVPYNWSITNGSFPPGLTLTSGAITGTPTTAGSYSFTVQVSDASNPGKTATKPLSITISDTPPVAATIWPSTTIPAVAADPDNAAVELGVKLKADVNGQITGIRFYKGITNTGIHMGTLWDSNGNPLARATFTNETASGWQQVNFAAPVSIVADTVYVASYHTNVGHYAANTNFFTTAGVDNSPLHALSSGASGGNGVYVYSANSAFPASTYQASNYWVDVVFTTSTGSDTTPPTVTMSSPANGATVTGAAVAVTANASDNVGVMSVQFLLDGTALGSPDTNTPYSINWDATTTTNGAHTLSARASDAAGNTATATAFGVTVSNGGTMNTGFLAASANAPVTTNAGDNNGFQNTPANAYGDDGLFAVDTNSGTNTNTSCTNNGKDKHIYQNYGFSLANDATIKGIEVRLDAKVDNTANAPKMCVQLSWDGGLTWTAAKSTGALTMTETTYVLGGTADTWGRIWASGDLSNTSFRLRIINVASSTARDFSLDWVTVRVTYQ